MGASPIPFPPHFSQQALIAALEIKWRNCWWATTTIRKLWVVPLQHWALSYHESSASLSGVTFSISQLTDPRCQVDLYQSVWSISFAAPREDSLHAAAHEEHLLVHQCSCLTHLCAPWVYGSVHIKQRLSLALKNTLRPQGTTLMCPALPWKN